MYIPTKHKSRKQGSRSIRKNAKVRAKNRRRRAGLAR
jgi:hypothetical protein